MGKENNKGDFATYPPMQTKMKRTKVVVIGGGFAGLKSVRKLHERAIVTVVEPKEYFEYTPGEPYPNPNPDPDPDPDPKPNFNPNPNSNPNSNPNPN